MGIEAKPLIVRTLEAMENRVEVLIAESRLAYSVAGKLDGVDEVQLMTLLVSFDPQPAQRWSARALAATFIAAHCHFEQLPKACGLGEWLGALLNQRAPASLSIVLQLPDHSETVEQEVGRFLTDLHKFQRHQLNLVIALAERPADWNNRASIDGFVVAADSHKGSAALQVFHMLSALMAPGMSFCADAEDLREVFGFSNQPSRIGNGVWLTQDAIFIASSEDDRQALQASAAVVLMPSTPLRIAAQTQLLKSIRTCAPSDMKLITMAPYGMSAESYLSNQIVPVIFVTTGLDPLL